MGLDGLELIVSIEEHFNIDISEQEACKINTVNDMLHCINDKLSLVEKESIEKQDTLYLFTLAFSELGFHQIDFNAPLQDQLSSTELNVLWVNLKHRTDLQLPDLSKQKGLFSKKSNKALKALSLHQIIDWIIALNYRSLIYPQTSYSVYETSSILSGILINLLYIPFQDIKPNAHFMNDLGLD